MEQVTFEAIRILPNSMRAMAAARIIKSGKPAYGKYYSREALSTELNVSVNSISNAIRILKTGIVEVVEAVDNGKIGTSPAYQVAKLEPELQSRFLAEKMAATGTRKSYTSAKSPSSIRRNRTLCTAKRKACMIALVGLVRVLTAAGIYQEFEESLTKLEIAIKER